MNVGILGCGHVSDQYFDGCARQEAIQVVACADLDVNRAEQKAAEHRVPRAYSPQELMADSEVDLVVNLTPPLAHAKASLAAIGAGKHVWSEKPLPRRSRRRARSSRPRARPEFAWAARPTPSWAAGCRRRPS